MADKIRDAEDRFLESMLRSNPIDDDGFSRKVVARIRQRIWVRRLALPTAMLIGGAIAFKPASQLLLAASKLLTAVPQDLVEAPMAWLPELQEIGAVPLAVQAIVFGAVLLGIGIFGSRSFSD